MMRGKDPEYLRREQYRTDENLRARIEVHERFSTNPVGLHRWLFEQLHLPARADLIEVGCGNGELWVRNASALPPGWHLVLVDLSEGMVEETRRRTAGLRPPPEVSMADVQHLSWAPGSFDAALANYLLFHVPDLERATSEIARVLRPSGRLFAATNGRGHMEELQVLQRRFGPGEEHDHHTFTLENGAEVLQRHFGAVELRRYVDDLRITDPEAAIGYVLSGVPKGLATPDRVASLRAEVARLFARQGGVLRVRKSTGLFVASDPKP